MLRPEHEHADAEPVCLYLTLASADIWARWYRRPSANADAVGEAVPRGASIVGHIPW